VRYELLKGSLLIDLVRSTMKIITCAYNLYRICTDCPICFRVIFITPQNEHNKKGEQVGEWGLVKKCYLLAKFYNRYKVYM
jgi:hypothetical protein